MSMLNILLMEKTSMFSANFDQKTALLSESLVNISSIQHSETPNFRPFQPNNFKKVRNFWQFCHFQKNFSSWNIETEER